MSFNEKTKQMDWKDECVWMVISVLSGVLLWLALAVVAFGFLFGMRYGLRAGADTREIEIAFFAPSASSVAVVGDFNEWNPGSHRMEQGDAAGVWRVKMKLSPGVYEYGFLIDGRDWSKDPNAEKFHADGFGGENSVLFIEG